MNRIFLLFVLIIMFLSCGNSVPEHDQRPASLFPDVYTELPAVYRSINTRLDEFFTGMNQSGSFNGSVLVAKSGTILFQKSLGIQNKQTGAPLSDTSMFQLASVTKVLTATGVLLLHERGLIDINRSCADYLTDFPYQGVTVRDLLSHRSGVPNYLYCLNAEICKPDYRMNNTEMYNSLVSKNVPPYLKPDKRFNYCNTNYALLALLIEKVSGKPYQVFMKDEIFTPLGMKHTATILDIDLDGANITKPYDNRWKPVDFDASDFVLGDKSIYSTPYDLYLFSEALYQDRIISPETQRLAYTAYSKEQKLSNYGFGWRMKNFKDPDKKEVYHNGWWHGYRSAFHRRLKDTLTVVILSNQLNITAYQAHKVYEIIDSTVSSESYDEEE